MGFLHWGPENTGIAFVYGARTSNTSPVSNFFPNLPVLSVILLALEILRKSSYMTFVKVV